MKTQDGVDARLHKGRSGTTQIERFRATRYDLNLPACGPVLFSQLCKRSGALTEYQTKHHVLRPPWPTADTHMPLLVLGHTDPPTPARQNLLDNNITDPARWIRYNAMLIQQVLASILQDASLMPRRVYRRRAYRTSIGVVSKTLRTQTFCKVQSADFTDAVIDQSRGSDERCHGGDGHNMSLPLLQHFRNKCADEHEVAHEVDLYQALALCITRLFFVSLCIKALPLPCRSPQAMSSQHQSQHC